MLLRCNVNNVCRLYHKNLLNEIRIGRSFSTEYSDKANYPEILEVSPAAEKRRAKLALHEKYRNLNTIEEKLLALNFPRYWGWETLVLREGELPYNFLPFSKYVTRTHFEEISTLPVSNCAPDFEPKDLANVIKSQIQEAILFETYERRHKSDYEEITNGDVQDDIKVNDVKLQSILNQINRILIINLAQYVPHLISTEVDYNPRLEAFWRVGGFKRSVEEHRIRTEKLERDDIPFDWKEEDGDELEHWFQYFGSPILQLRTSLPLEPIDDDVNTSVKELENIIDKENRVSPHFHGIKSVRRFGTSVPGFWPGNHSSEFGLLSYHSCNHLLGRPSHFQAEEHADALHAQAILAGYSWSHGLASYQGFSTFNEITYPLVSQHVITDGKFFSFYFYQLNTLLMHKEFYDNNERCNLCYGTPKMKLYDEIKGREFIGWNDEVLTRLISMYMNKISKREHDMKPNVNKSEVYVADITDTDERREWLHYQLQYMYSNRPRHRLAPEIFDWEWIYKIKFMTRPMDRRMRPFEKWQDPLNQRKYNEYTPPYIPKNMRYPDKPRQKFRKTYFPDAF